MRWQPVNDQTPSISEGVTKVAMVQREEAEASRQNRATAVREALAAQAISCRKLGSPFMGQLMALLAERLEPGSPVADCMLGWTGDPGVAADNPSLRLAGALHGIVIDGQDADLQSVYPPHRVSDDDLWDAVRGALDRHHVRLLSWLDRPPQTNEVRRASALIPSFAMVARATGLPLALWELGCAGGLNLRADQFGVEAAGFAFGPQNGRLRLAPEWEGDAPEPYPIEVIERRGVDLTPLDPVADRTCLLAYLWPDQPERRAITEYAIAIAAAHPADIEAGDAVAFLRASLRKRRDHAVTVIYHTVAWQYLPANARAEGDRLIAEAGAGATRDKPLARISMENDGQGDAALALSLWRGARTPETVFLGRVDFHGRRVHWTGPSAL